MNDTVLAWQLVWLTLFIFCAFLDGLFKNVWESLRNKNKNTHIVRRGYSVLHVCSCEHGLLAYPVTYTGSESCVQVDEDSDLGVAPCRTRTTPLYQRFYIYENGECLCYGVVKYNESVKVIRLFNRRLLSGPFLGS